LNIFIDFSNSEENKPQLKPEALIIDLSCVPFMDNSGVQTIIDIIKILKEQNICVYLASCPIHVIELFEKSKFFSTVKNKCIYPTIHDAVVNLT
jgi:anti-anti-sigma regulatory factor